MNLKLKKRWLTQQEEIFGKSFYLTNINSTNFNKNDDSKKVILFSPCAASFDQFKNFEERGKFFNVNIKYVIKKVRI